MHAPLTPGPPCYLEFEQVHLSCARTNLILIKLFINSELVFGFGTVFPGISFRFMFTIKLITITTYHMPEYDTVHVHVPFKD